MFIDLLIAGLLFTVMCSFVKAKWGYSRRDLFRESPLELALEKWIFNPARYFIVYWLAIGAFYFIKAYGPSLLSGVQQ